MSTLHGKLPTAHAAKYMQQLVKHWSHKFETQLDTNSASVQLPGGKVSFESLEGELRIEIDPSAEDTGTQMIGVVERHLERFAFREAPLAFSWSQAD